MPMNIAWISSSGMIELVRAVIPPRSDEYVSQSWLTACMSSGSGHGPEAVLLGEVG